MPPYLFAADMNKGTLSWASNEMLVGLMSVYSVVESSSLLQRRIFSIFNIYAFQQAESVIG